MKKSEITKKVIEIIRKDFSQIKYEKMTDNLIDCGFDSLTTIEMIIRIEDTFGFEFYDEDLLMSNLSTIQAIVDYIEMRLSEENIRESMR